VQVYPKRDEAGHVAFECLMIRGGRLFVARLDGSLAPLSR